jgi:hypothetical protein
VVSLVLDEASLRGLVAVRDNGVGMTPRVRSGRAAWCADVPRMLPEAGLRQQVYMLASARAAVRPSLAFPCR